MISALFIGIGLVMEMQFSDHFTFGKLIRFTMPSIVMMIFTSIYGVVDGIFVSNYVGKTPFAAINIIWPVFMILGAVGFMIGTGGCALVSKIRGEGEEKKANQIFSKKSLLRTLLFQVVAVLVLPMFFELDGIWYAVIVAELLALVVTILFIVTQKKKYKYL